MEADDEQDVKPNIIEADLDDPDSGEDIEVLEVSFSYSDVEGLDLTRT